MGPISTMKLQDTPPSEEERSRREGILNTIQESIGYLESGNRGPEWQMGYIYPPGLRAQVPLETQKLASKARRGIYKQIKKDIQQDLLDVEKRVLEHASVDHPAFNEYVRTLAKPYIHEYQNRIKAVTALPDSIVARARRTKLIGKRNQSLGQWGPHVSKTGKDVGGTLYIKPYIADGDDVILHELGGHAATGSGEHAVNLLRSNNKSALEAWKNVPAESKETLQNLGVIERFDDIWLRNNPAGDRRYAKNYHRWPSEQFSNEVPAIVLANARHSKQRLTTDKYLKTTRLASRRAAEKAKKLDLEFSQNSKSRIRDFWDKVIGK